MQRSSHLEKAALSKPAHPQLRPRPCVHLCTGDAVGAFIEYATRFEEQPVSFGRQAGTPAKTASHWIAEKIQDVASLCAALDYIERPLVMPVPACSLMDANMLQACSHAASQTRLCHQEISLELSDAAITAHPNEARAFMHAFRRKGFRISIDARKSWASDLPREFWLLVDTLRIKAGTLETEPKAEDLVADAALAGVAVVAEQPYWRDGEYLSSMGIDYGLSPRADA